MGYVLNRHFDIPPIMFTKEEIEALVIAARLSKTWAGSKLAHSTELALAKIESVMPEHLKSELSNPRVYTPEFLLDDSTKTRLDDIRCAINSKCVITIEYSSLKEETTRRDLRPLGLFFWGKTWTLAAWCELRQGYRNFRIDRISLVHLTSKTFEENEQVSLERFLNETYQGADKALFIE